MCAEHGNARVLVLRRIVAKLCTRIHAQVAAIDFEKWAFNEIPYNTSLNIISWPPARMHGKTHGLKMEDRLERCSMVVIMQRSHWFYVNKPVDSCSYMIHILCYHARECSCSLSWAIPVTMARVTIFTCFLCTVCVHPLRTHTAYYGHCWKKPSYWVNKEENERESSR